ncbi:MAG: ChaN family lipoprotein [Deltaproteobacteria bacterium]|nr:ChaN family lipoprotein [Deltaproteobacteria bacterium]
MFQRYGRWSLYAVLFFLLACGCAGRKRQAVPLATLEGVRRHFGIGRIIQTESGSAIGFDQLIARIASRDVVFVGEVHDNPEHHLLQIQVLQALAETSGPLAIAMEVFPKPLQPLLDRYVQGEIEEDEFLKEIDWERIWGYDYHLYRPLMQLARSEGIRVLAINAPVEIVRKVARTGLEGLAPAEREQLAEKIDLNNRAHRGYLRKVYEQHIHGELTDFDFFYQAQCVWEDTMASNIAEYWREHGGRVVVFIGNGHIVNGFGVPDRTTGRLSVSMATLMPYPLRGRATIARATADYLWLTPEYPRRFRMTPVRTGDGAGRETTSRPGGHLRD